MNRVFWTVTFILCCLFCLQGIGLAETMYVTDRLYLSLRSTPDPEQPAVTLLPSDTKVEVVATEDDWAQVKLEDGKTGWVLKRFLAEDRPKSLLIEELQRQIEELQEEIENESAVIERLKQEKAPQRADLSDQATPEPKQQEEALLRRIETLKNQIIAQKKRLEVNTKESTEKRLKEVYLTGIVSLFLGLVVGYMMRRPKKRQLFY